MRKYPVSQIDRRPGITNRYPWLYTIVERLAEGLEVTIPEAAELGIKLYMEVA